MKKIFTLLFTCAFATGLYAQLDTTFTFETAFADTSWKAFDNFHVTFPDSGLSVVLNPWANDINGSDSVLQFIVAADAYRWTGAFIDLDLFGQMVQFTEEAKTLGLMVYKPVVSPVGLKVERSMTEDEPVSMYLTNAVTDDWELLTYEFDGAIGKYWQRLTFFPHFPEAGDELGEEITVYIDNIGVPMEDNTSVKDFSGISMKLYPNPADFRMAVQCPDMTGITVSDQLGRKIRSISFASTDSKVIEVGDLKTGIYLVTAECRNGNFTMPFVKK
jgi:hypothetical protein